MTLSRKEIAAARDVYEIYWDSYFSGNSEEFGNTIDPQFTMIGTSESEVSFGKAEAIEILMAQYDEVVGKAERRNRQVKEIPTGDMLQIIEFCDIYVLIDSDWSFYSKFRLSTLLHQTPDGWKLLQQHGSLPDMRVEEGETVAVEKISKENLELRDAIKRRTIELENKSRELEIEAALERVRSRSMAMQNSNELKAVIKVVYEQLSNLNINLDHAGFVVDYSPQDDWHFWIADDREIPSKITHPYFESVWANQFNEAKKNGTTHFVTHLNFEEKNKFYHELLSHVSGLTETSKDFYLSCPGLAATTALFDDFSLYIENFSGIPYKEEENEIVLRFGKVFQQAYTRFLDLQKAEAQAREAQIETALEKVRSRTMAMQHSDELQEASYLLDQQVRSLGIQTWGCAFNIYGEEDSTEWFGNEAGVLHTYTVPRKGIFKEYYEKGQRGESIIINEFSGKACVDHYEYMSKLPVLGDVLKILKETNDGFPTYQIDHVVYFKYGYLLFITREDVPEAHGIFKRFAKVFEQTYTRFLDLQKAEAQAREAQIEASLERVRSRSMAMQKTEELTDSGALLYQELSKLGIQNLSTGYTLFDETATMGWSYGVNPTDGSIRHKPVGMDHTKTKVMKAIAASWKKQEPLLVLQLNEQETIKHQTFIADECIDFPISKEQLLAISPKRLVVHTFNFKQGYLLIVGGELLTEAQQHMISRFAKVFQQTYTRFLDLQKSEAQAREAKIEAALEKVRSRSLAMHQSQELNEVVMVLFEKLKDLQIPSTAVAIQTFREDSKDMQVFVCGDVGTGLVINYYLLPYFNHRIINDYHAARKDRSDFYIGNYSKKEKDSFYDYVLKLPELKDLPSEVEQMIRQSTHYSITMVPAEKSLIAVNDFEGKVLAESEVGIIKRFAKVFDQAYTRFLDLQKAEAQAREAQIEAAVERVRAQSMAMHHTDDLHKVTKELLHQLNGLSVDGLTGTTIYLVDENDIVRAWDLSSPGSISTPDSYTVIYDAKKYPVLGGWVKEWRNTDQNYFALEFPEEALLKAVEEWKEVHPEIATIFKNAVDSGKLAHQWSPSGRLSKGILAVDLTKPPTEDTKDIVTKMSGAFNLAYQRFEDLQKAEAQTREAKIETALEKVRSRTMGMQSSDELPEVANLMFIEIQSLGIPAWSCGYCIEREDGKSCICIMSSEGALQKPFVLPYHGEASFDEWNDFVHSERTFITQELSGKAIESHYDFMKSLPQLEPVFQELVDAGLSLPTHQINHLCKFKYGFLLFITYEQVEGSHEVFKRFTKVFDQIYTRFLDLKQAETQAREAQIEAALEKVRSRSLAMQKSDELLAVIIELSSQLQQLNVRFDFVSFGVIGPENEIDFWMAGEGYTQPELYHMPYFDHFVTNSLLEDQKKGLRFSESTFNQKDTREWMEVLYENNPKSKMLADTKEHTLTGPGMVRASVILKNICVFMGNFRLKPHSKEQNALLIRFANAFEQAYTRFLDLQKAETQAREAKIETALEKVRSRTMGMQKSDELADVADVLFKEMNNLVHNLWTCGFVLCEKDREEDEWWLGLEEGFTRGFFLPNVNDYAHAHLYEGWLKREDFRTVQLEGDKLQAHYDWLMKIPVAKNIFEEMEAAGMQRPEWQKLHAAYFSKGYLVIITREPCPEEDIFKRFAQVFDLTYTRFLDLQKAEAQAREAQIENALEKVRSRSLAMQSPDELIEVAELLREEMGALGVEELETSSIYIHDDSTNLTQCWFTIKDADDQDKSITDQMTIDLQDTWVGQEMLEFYRSGTKQTSVKMVGDQRIEWIRYCGEKSNLFTPDGFYGDSIPERTYHLYKFSNGYIGAASPGEISDESWDLLRRATSVFSFAYTRFMDLKKAKEQTREAQIELSLERIRARVTGMQESSDLLDIVVTMRTEFVNLGHEAHYFWHMRWLPDTYKKAMTSGDGTKIGMVMTLPRHIHGDIEEVAAWEKTKDPIHVLAMDVDVAVDYVDKMISLGDFERVDPQAPTLDDIRHIGGLTFVMARTTHGEIGFSLPGVVHDPPKEAVDTLVRFAGVFDLAYRRFEDLKKAEAQARENQIELALEKVRSRTMTMERSSELADTSVVVFKELLNLGIAPNRLFIGIIKENGNAVEAWATNEDGSKIENQFQLYPSENKSIQNMVNAWKQEKKSTIIDMSGKELKDYFHYLNKVMRIPFIDGLQQKRRVQTIAYFSGGLIGMAAPEEQPRETTELLERFAAVFNLTYTRFNDLKIAEKQALQAEKDLIEIKQARQKAEDALIELKATQTQLVQQEKLASLGQLTAGIAHEIKNPLNFVNNFSELSMELIDEVFEELEKLEASESSELMAEILRDVKSNLVKVHQHGTRADGIVKSMLQHSRGGNGKMEPTDINALIREYTNLVFHGMRAGSNPINVELELELDSKIIEVPLIGEDFSRVILNLCNNAFDAMRETEAQRLPKLTIRTYKTNKLITIDVEDNGPGIPDAIKDKVLQPFFTTKKGTDGTGLGLSITNDIIKAHGGEITIDSSQGKGTTFSIHLSTKGL